MSSLIFLVITSICLVIALIIFLQLDLIIETDGVYRRFFSATRICLRSCLRRTSSNKFNACLDCGVNSSNKLLRSAPYFANAFASSLSVLALLPYDLIKFLTLRVSALCTAILWPHRVYNNSSSYPPVFSKIHKDWPKIFL